jgi:hypothetical protein
MKFLDYFWFVSEKWRLTFFLRQYEVLRSSAELVLSFCVWFTCVGIMNFASAAYYAALQPQKVDKGIQVSGTVTRLMFLTSYILF